MKTTIMALLVLAAIAGCKQHGDNAQRKTKFPGMVTADGGTSGQVMAAHGGPKTDAGYAGGTPGIAGGSGGNTGGAATGGAVRETGQGPSQGVTPPGGAGTQGTTQTQPGDNGKPAAPTPAETGPQPGAVNRDPSHSAAPGR
ncbi:hypothetical protein [Massilia putida]|uniref:hypothetical protein n=1 Tax=Massilia putida TaxID=1141883 RepID=UPI000950CDFB|nr:hypothetical protein [Massilia putida]